MAIVAGTSGRRLIAAGVAASSFGFLDLVILVSPRVYQAMARDGLFFAALADLHPRWRTPLRALLLQAIVALALIITGPYRQPPDWVFVPDCFLSYAPPLTL